MEANAQTIQQDVEEIFRNLLSRDPALFNAALNTHFTASSRYHGHALEIRGLKAIRHVAWAFALLDWGRGAEIQSDEITWNEDEATAVAQTTQYLRPIFFPLFTFGVPVKSKLQFQKSSLRPSKGSKRQLRVTRWEDEWPIGHWLEHLPLFGTLFRRLVAPVISFFITVLATLVFGVFAWLTTAQRHYVDSSARESLLGDHRAADAAPPAVRQGFSDGAGLAQGWGHRIRSRFGAPLRILEHGAQAVTGVLRPITPFALPQIAVFDPPSRNSSQTSAPLNEPIPLRAQRSLHASESHSQRTQSDDAKNPRGAAQFSETADLELPAAMATRPSDIKAATVEVGPAVDGSAPQGGSYNIPDHQFNEGPAKAPKSESDEPARKTAESDNKPSFFDEARADAEQLQQTLETSPKPKKTPKKSSKKSGEEHPRAPKFEDGLDDGQYEEPESDGTQHAHEPQGTPPPLYEEESAPRSTKQKTAPTSATGKPKKKKKKSASSSATA
ncbi:unnamed protein product [Parajaminaea phylloscopi]